MFVYLINKDQHLFICLFKGQSIKIKQIYHRVLYNTITTVVGLVRCGKWLCVAKDFMLLYPRVAYAHCVPWLSLAFLGYQYLCRQTSLSERLPFMSMTTNMNVPIMSPT